MTVEKEVKRKRVNLTDYAYFVQNREFLCQQGRDFDYYSSGTVNKILTRDLELVFIDVAQYAGKGYHLSRIFRRDINRWLELNTIEKHSEYYQEQMFHLGAIEKSVGYPSVAIDINDCYWRTSAQLGRTEHSEGYISEKTYIMGKKKDEWKTGRNACIGALCKSEYITPYREGKADYKRRYKIPYPEEYDYIRNHIIGHVYQLFYRLYQQLGDHFYMFLTDCVFTDYRRANYIQKYLAAHGYRVKMKPIEFTGVDRKKQIVKWYDFEAEKKDDKGKVIQKGINKYYNYATHQVLDGMEFSPIQIPQFTLPEETVTRKKIKRSKK